MKPFCVVVHSQHGKTRHDAFDFPNVDADMERRGVHYEVFGEMVNREGKPHPVIIRQWPNNLVGAGCRGWNGSKGGHRAMNFCFAGNGMVESPPDELLAEMARFIREAMENFDIPIDRVKLHRDMPGASTDCPGKVFIKEAWPKLLALLK